MLKKVLIRTYGCQMNVRDSELICGLLKDNGYQIIEDSDKADVILLNTCSVRQHAEDKVWSEVGRLTKHGKASKKHLIGIIGCMAKNYEEEIFSRMPQVDFAVGPSDIDKIPGIIERLLLTKNSKVDSNDLLELKIWETDGEVRPEEIYHTGFYQDKKHAYIVISEGCSNFCSYCVVPYVRGPLRHRDYRDILREIEQTLDKGINKFTLLGQNVNAYEYGEVTFSKLVRLIDSVNGLEEFSFITSHPKDTGLDLFMVMADSAKLKKCLHLPLQAGSDRILKLMNRGYTSKKYLGLIEDYRSIVKGAVLTTDIIIGFPSETESDFLDTYNLVKEVKFNSAYIFKYSPRPHTPAFNLSDNVTKAEKERRHALILSLQKGISKKFCILVCFFGFCLLSLSSFCYALDIGKVKTSFLSGDYKAAIIEGEKVLANTEKGNAHLDELYYILGLSYMKDGNYLRASDIFEIILREMKESPFRQDAQLALGDNYFLQRDYARAESYYKELIRKSGGAKFSSLVYYRLSQISFKKGDLKEAKEYLDKMKKEYPLGAETILNKELYLASDSYYSIQVGSFSSMSNAQNLTQKLQAKGYPAYLEKVDSGGRASYRVRVGKMHTRQEVLDLEKKLSLEGYPTKIYP